MLQELYPLTFAPIPEPSPWGGSGLLAEQYPEICGSDSFIGNCWEIVDSDERQSVVDDGPLAGATLRQLVDDDPGSLIGGRYDGSSPFPLQVKFVDTAQQMPVTVHPVSPAEAANMIMWYVVAARENADLCVGLQPRFAQQQFLGRVDAPNFHEIKQIFPAHPGDAFFVIPGRIHALGAGILTLAIQCNDAETLTIRKADGSPRDEPLDRQTLLSSIDFQNRTISRIRGESSDVVRNWKVPLITHCPAFAVDEVRLVEEMHDRADGTTFHLLTAIDNPIAISCANGSSCELAAGRTALIPAALGYYSIRPVTPPSRLLRTVAK
jgi:mannose-6-phosphate isomerase